MLNLNSTLTTLFDWIVLDTASGHTSSHAEFILSGNLMTITVDPDCNSIGEYYLFAEANKLALVAKNRRMWSKSVSYGVGLEEEVIQWN